MRRIIHQSNKRVRKLRFMRPPTHLLQSTLTVYFDTDTLTDFTQTESMFFPIHANVNNCQTTRCRARQGTAGSSPMRNVFKQKHRFDQPEPIEIITARNVNSTPASYQHCITTRTNKQIKTQTLNSKNQHLAISNC